MTPNRLIAALGGALRRSPPGIRAVSAQGELDAARSASHVGKSELSEEEKREVERLRRHDGEVRRHEQAHKSAAGTYAQGAPTFKFETGPDGRRYAVGGEVQIDTAAVEGDPEATIRKMQQIRRAALAPSEPSGQDRQVAAKAAAQERQARAELARETKGGSVERGAAIGATGAVPERAFGAAGAIAGDTPRPSRALDTSRRGLLHAYRNGPTGRFIDTAA